MQQASGELTEIYLENGLTEGRLLCPRNVIPSAGQYLLACNPVTVTPLPVPVFSAGSVPGGFLVAPPLPQEWQPGDFLSLRGPLGQGFSLPANAHCVALVALGETAARLKPLLWAALEQGASAVMVSNLGLPNLPPEVEIQPVSALGEVIRWADYLAIDVPRESLTGLREMPGLFEPAWVRCEAQVLVITPMPCGGIAECGVCAVTARRGWKMACKDGPVFDLSALI